MTAPIPPIARLKRRADFLRAAKGRRCHVGAFSLQAGPADHEGVRFGFTLTKKVGNAVVRNRARRRLKEAVRLSGALPVAAGHDYVLVGRDAALKIPFATLQLEIARAVRFVHAGPARQKRGSSARPSRVIPPAIPKEQPEP